MAAEVCGHRFDLRVGGVQMKYDRLTGIEDLHQQAEFRPMLLEQARADHLLRHRPDCIAQTDWLIELQIGETAARYWRWIDRFD